MYVANHTMSSADHHADTSQAVRNMRSDYENGGAPVIDRETGRLSLHSSRQAGRDPGDESFGGRSARRPTRNKLFRNVAGAVEVVQHLGGNRLDVGTAEDRPVIRPRNDLDVAEVSIQV